MMKYLMMKCLKLLQQPRGQQKFLGGGGQSSARAKILTLGAKSLLSSTVSSQDLLIKLLRLRRTLTSIF